MILIFKMPLFYIKVSKVIISQVSGLFLNWSLAFCIWEWHLDTPEVWTCSWLTDLKKIRWNGFRIKACSCLITCGLWCKLGHVNLGGISPNKIFQGWYHTWILIHMATQFLFPTHIKLFPSVFLQLCLLQSWINDHLRNGKKKTKQQRLVLGSLGSEKRKLWHNCLNKKAL